MRWPRARVPFQARGPKSRSGPPRQGHRVGARSTRACRSIAQRVRRTGNAVGAQGCRRAKRARRADPGRRQMARDAGHPRASAVGAIIDPATPVVDRAENKSILRQPIRCALCHERKPTVGPLNRNHTKQDSKPADRHYTRLIGWRAFHHADAERRLNNPCSHERRVQPLPIDGRGKIPQCPRCSDRLTPQPL